MRNLLGTLRTLLDFMITGSGTSLYRPTTVSSIYTVSYVLISTRVLCRKIQREKRTTKRKGSFSQKKKREQETERK